MARLVKDPELMAMEEIARVLQPLSPAALRRVRAWLFDRYGDEGETVVGVAASPADPAKGA